METMDYVSFGLALVSVVYPAALFLLPPQMAAKIRFGVAVAEKVVTVLQKAEKSPAGLKPYDSLIGRRVRHAIFGYGEIVSVKGDNLVIDFNGTHRDINRYFVSVLSRG